MLPLALLIDGTVSTNVTELATFQVYAVPECRPVGEHGHQTTTYQLPDDQCVNTPPIPNVESRFLSYKTKINDGVTATGCFFDIYPEKNCTGNFSGFEAAPENSNICQNVLQGFTGTKETFGAKSVRVSCFGS